MRLGVEAALAVLAGLSITACEKKSAEARAEPARTVAATEVPSAAPSALPSASSGKDGTCAPGGCAPGKCGGSTK